MSSSLETPGFDTWTLP